VWVLDGHASYAQLLKFALPAEAMPNTLVMFVASMTTPWAILEQLQNWASVLHDHIDALKIPADQLQEYRQQSRCSFFFVYFFFFIASCHD
jgi:dynein light intermediate chain 1